MQFDKIGNLSFGVVQKMEKAIIKGVTIAVSAGFIVGWVMI